MRKSLNSLTSFQKTELNITAFLVAILVLGLWGRTKLHDVQTHQNVPALSAARIYFPSPFEYDLLVSRAELWPGVFSALNPVHVDQLPSLYETLRLRPELLPKDGDFSPILVNFFRHWSVLAWSSREALLVEALLGQNANQIHLLKKDPKQPTFMTFLRNGFGATEADCSRILQEKAYWIVRLSQSEALPKGAQELFNSPKVTEEGFKYLERCRIPKGSDVDDYMVFLKKYLFLKPIKRRASEEQEPASSELPKNSQKPGYPEYREFLKTELDRLSKES